MAKSTIIVERVKVFNPILNYKYFFPYDRLGWVCFIVGRDLLSSTIINSMLNIPYTYILILSNVKGLNYEVQVLICNELRADRNYGLTNLRASEILIRRFVQLANNCNLIIR
jgi:hypothetical protein